jgi:6-phosphofructokinase 1
MGAVKRKLKLSVIFIPKSIENNFPFIDKCIGFDTVVQGAVDAIHRVLLAASSVQGGIGIIKLGSGFMCLNAVMASGDADVCLLKAIPFQPKVVMEYVAKVIASKGYAIIVVEDGAAEDLVKKWKAKLDEEAAQGISRKPVGGSMDECIGKRVPSHQEDLKGFSGQVAGYDVGQYLKETAIEHFAQQGMQVTVRLSTPEWYIRSMPALASDRIFCTIVASTAVHGAFAGLMNVVIGRVNQRYVYIPTAIISEKNRPVVKETSRMYNRMIRATGQPSFQRLGHAKLITGRGDVRRAFTPDQALSDMAGDKPKTFGV